MACLSPSNNNLIGMSNNDKRVKKTINFFKNGMLIYVVSRFKDF